MAHFKIDPVNRIEGHLGIKVNYNPGAGNTGVVNFSKFMGQMWRGFETIMPGRDPRDAPIICQRI